MSSEFPDEMTGVGFGGSMDEQDGGDDGDDEEVEHERLLVFEIGDREYAATVEAVKTVVEPGDITRVPLSSDAIEGIVDLRGEITAVINPRVHFGVTSSSMSPELERLVIFNRPPDHQPAGIRVDRVIGVEAFPAPLFYHPEEFESDAYEGQDDLITAVVQRFEDDEVTDRIGVIDTEAMVDASGRVAAEPGS
ncbi:MAG: purine-binding chemotaxis protein CheW [Halobacteriales archaeon]|jgi:purine-binding chemotaxis protein CheW